MSRIAVLCGTGMSSLSNDISPSSENTIVRVDTDWGEVPVTISHLQEGMVAVVDRHHSIGEKRTPPHMICLLYTSPSPRDLSTSRMPSSA